MSKFSVKRSPTLQINEDLLIPDDLSIKCEAAISRSTAFAASHLAPVFTDLWRSCRDPLRGAPANP